MQHEIKKVNLLGIDVWAMTMDQLLDVCQQRIETGKSILLGVLNVAKAINSKRDNLLKSSLDEADIVVADGTGIVWLSKLIGKPLPERVAGIDIMDKLLQRADQNNYRVFFLGAKRQIVEKVVEVVNQTYPGVQIAGLHDGYFTDDQQSGVAEQIRTSNADILFVAMPSPKKEKFLGNWHKHMNVAVCHGVGGSFDVVAGLTKRAPLWMQNHGLEWFYRFLQEPGRMWKRYLVTNGKFALMSIPLIIKERFKKVISFTSLSGDAK